MKKYLALILSLVLIASLLAGCGAATGGEAMKDSAAALPNADNLYGNAMPEGSARSAGTGAFRLYGKPGSLQRQQK